MSKYRLPKARVCTIESFSYQLGGGSWACSKDHLWLVLSGCLIALSKPTAM